MCKTRFKATAGMAQEIAGQGSYTVKLDGFGSKTFTELETLKRAIDNSVGKEEVDFCSNLTKISSQTSESTSESEGGSNDKFDKMVASVVTDKAELLEDEAETKEDDHADDHEDMDLENLIAKDWTGVKPEAPLQRRQKRRQRQRANAKVGRALRRFIQRSGHKQSAYNQYLLEQAQTAVVAYLDYLFGPMNLPGDEYLNGTVLDSLFKSSTVAAIMHFEGIQQALAQLAPLETEMQLAIVVDALRWSQSLRCGPVCYPNGEIVYFVRVKPHQQQQQQPSVLLAPVAEVQTVSVLATPVWVCVCGNCNQMVNAQFGYCVFCGIHF